MLGPSGAPHWLVSCSAYLNQDLSRKAGLRVARVAVTVKINAKPQATTGALFTSGEMSFLSLPFWHLISKTQKTVKFLFSLKPPAMSCSCWFNSCFVISWYLYHTGFLQKLEIKLSSPTCDFPCRAFLRCLFYLLPDLLSPFQFPFPESFGLMSHQKRALSCGKSRSTLRPSVCLQTLFTAIPKITGTCPA